MHFLHPPDNFFPTTDLNGSLHDIFFSPDSDQYYFFSYLACQLNEFDPDVAPTDSRRRPDQRLMENGNWDEANVEKARLENKQRVAKKQRAAEMPSKAYLDKAGSGSVNY